MIYDKITENIIGVAIEVHKAVGPGLLESAYQECLLYELRALGYSVKKEVSQPKTYKDLILDNGYRIDLLVENTVVIELKTVERFTDVHTAQILTYMKLGDYPVGLLFNFRSKLLKNGIKRFINTND
ncbi:GxxExxY protein [Winogradskyella maritima]|uniref:GxxExxY protein n=1 Tax=Winogradskyella maritima TaxID=1517766 RepID=A0ABV8AGT1_9FLAO|nr:GxxExxY protein [Winogradskyella maritima]